MINARSRWGRTCLAAVLSAAGSTVVAAQDPEWWAIDLSQPAMALVGATDPRASVRVAVLPIAAPNPEMIRIADQVTAQLVWTLQALPRAGALQLETVDRPAPASTANVKRITGRPPLGDSDIRRAGQQASADYVVSGTLTEGGNQLPSRVTLRLMDVRSGRTLASSAAPFTFPGVPTTEASRPVLKSKPFVGAVGALMTAVTTYEAFRSNTKVKEQNSALQAVPPGAADEWTRLHDAASGMAKERNFWWGVSIGLAGVTTSYLVLAESGPSAHRAVPTWRLALNGTTPQITIVRTF